MIQSVTDVAASVELLVSQAADEFAAALARGERPTVAEFAGRYPEIANLLRQVLPTIEAIGNLSPEGDADDATTAPKNLGDFLIEREIGRGGMGVVYRAKQISLGRTVALKVLPFAGVLDEKQLQRFKNEARAAATLEHPHIVPVYSVGCERGVHYFAMRFIDGQSLAEILTAIPGYRASETQAEANPSQQASQLAMPIVHRSSDLASSVKDAERESPTPAPDTRPEVHALISTDADFQGTQYLKNVARLGIQAAEALAYAHEQGILHRDIKPGNLLLDVNGDLWIADFGLARLEQDAGITITGDMMGTLRYMSPEQAQGQRLLDERADIYSLGITLYEMLVLRPAFSGRNREEILRRIATEEPKAPRQINPRIPRDLETIVLKAMSKEPESRYQSAQQLGDDLRRYLDDQPIHARRPRFVEKCVKWSRRHPATVWATILVLLTTTVVSAVSTTLVINAFNGEATARHQAEENEGHAKANAQQAKTNAHEAEANVQRADAISKFLVNALRSPDSRRDGRTVTVAELLARSEKELQNQFTDDPRTKAALLQAIGQSYVGLGLYGESLPLFQRAYDLRKHSKGVDFRDMVQSLQSLASMSAVLGHTDDAITRGEELVELVKSHMGPSHRSTLNAMGNLALAYTAAGRYDAALKLQEETLGLKRAAFGPEDAATLKTSHNLALAYRQAGRLQEGLRLLEKTREIQKAKLGADAPDTLSSTQALADYYIRLGRQQEAIPLLESVRDWNNRNSGPTHPETLRAMSSLAAAYQATGRTEDALALAEETLKLRKANAGSDQRGTLDAMIGLASGYQEAGRMDKALPLYEEALKTFKATLGTKDRDMVVFTGNLGQAYRVVGRLDEAMPLLEETFQRVKTDLGPDNPETLDHMNNLALAYLQAGRLSEALPMLEQILKLRKIKLPPDHPDTLGSMSNLAEAYRKAGRVDEAISLLETAIPLTRIKLGADAADTLDEMQNLGLAYLDADRTDKAIPLFEETLKLRKTRQGRDNPETLNTMSSLAEAYMSALRVADAIPLLEEAIKLEKARPGPPSNDVLETTDSLARAYVITGRPADAVPLLRATLQRRREKSGAENQDTLETMNNLAEALLGSAQLDEAEALARELLGIREKRLSDDWRTFQTQFTLGIVLLSQSKSEAAESLLLSGYEGMNARAEKMPERSRANMKRLIQVVVRLYEATDQPQKVVEWKAKMGPQNK